MVQSFRKVIKLKRTILLRFELLLKNQANILYKHLLPRKSLKSRIKCILHQLFEDRFPK